MSYYCTTTWRCIFLDFNVLQPITTLVTGLFVLFVYMMQKTNEKQKVSRLLLSEIFLAEKTIAELSSQGKQIQIRDFFFLMPNNSWQSYSYMFMKEFSTSEIEFITEFYNKCSYLERETQRLLNYLNIAMEEKARITQSKLVELAGKYGDNPETYTQQKEKMLWDPYYKEEDWFIPDVNKHRIIAILSTIRPISSTSIIHKLQKIAR